MIQTDDFDPMFETCESCGGAGYIDIGYCEDGVTDTCPECQGSGEVEFLD